LVQYQQGNLCPPQRSRVVRYCFAMSSTAHLMPLSLPAPRLNPSIPFLRFSGASVNRDKQPARRLLYA
jgi:hypothetical protein